MTTIENITVPPPAPGDMLDFRAIFDRDAPVEMEIGTGKGGFLLNRAKAHADRNFFGVEWANQIYRYAADRMARWGVTNVRLMRADAQHLVIHHVPQASVTMLHIYHPDPWPKKRHHKRRLVQLPFIRAATEILILGGRIAIQTDHAEYFQYICDVLTQEPRLTVAPFDVPEAGVIEGQVSTNYEIKYLREGRTIHQIALMKATST